MKALSIILLIWPLAACPQVKDDFEDGDFTHHPEWIGDYDAWEIEKGQLHSNRRLQSREKDTFYLSTASGGTKSTVWEFWVRLGFNTSGANFVRVYLTSKSVNPLAKGNQGYYVEIGGTNDRISLYRKDSLGRAALIEGENGRTNHYDNTLKIKVVCHENHEWGLFTDPSGAGSKYILEGRALDSAYPGSRYFSIVVFQSGKGASGKHWFDDISIHPFHPDTLHPSLENLSYPSSKELQLHFSEPLSTSSYNKVHYIVNDHRRPDSIYSTSDDPATLNLVFLKPFEQKNNYSIRLSGIMDLNGNNLDTTVHFTFFIPEAFDVVFNEIYPDPTPSHGLPPYEYVELLNTSGFPVSLHDWQFCDPVRCAALPDIVLSADSLLILCDEKYVSDFSSFGEVAGLKKFPTLNNEGDRLYLKNKHGKIIYSVKYNKKSYQDEEKAQGGWSLEMQYPEHPCLVTHNWAASKNPAGGSPGALSYHPHQNKPFLDLEYAAAIDSFTLLTGFNAGLNPALLKPQNFTLTGFSIDSLEARKPLFSEIKLYLKEPLKKRKIYSLRVKDLQNCGLQIGEKNEQRFGISESPLPGDLFINEILFNPREGGSDFIEIYNASKKIIDIRTLLLANRNKNGAIADINILSADPFYLFPEEYVVVTTDKRHLISQYFCRYPKNIVQADKMPSYPNHSGTVALLDTGKNKIDEVSYREGQQYAFYHAKKGVSLEKINSTGPSEDPDNWASASSLSGYATPTYQNSQLLTENVSKINFEVKPGVFSPDGDGYEDQTFLIYKLRPGFSATIRVYNEYGQPVRQLKTHVSLGTHNRIPWNGRNDNGAILPTGIYLFNILLYGPDGEVKRLKLPVVLAKRR